MQLCAQTLELAGRYLELEQGKVFLGGVQRRLLHLADGAVSPTLLLNRRPPNAIWLLVVQPQAR